MQRLVRREIHRSHGQRVHELRDVALGAWDEPVQVAQVLREVATVVTGGEFEEAGGELEFGVDRAAVASRASIVGVVALDAGERDEGIGGRGERIAHDPGKLHVAARVEVRHARGVGAEFGMLREETVEVRAVEGAGAVRLGSLEDRGDARCLFRPLGAFAFLPTPAHEGGEERAEERGHERRGASFPAGVSCQGP